MKCFDNSRRRTSAAQRWVLAASTAATALAAAGARAATDDDATGAPGTSDVSAASGTVDLLDTAALPAPAVGPIAPPPVLRRTDATDAERTGSGLRLSGFGTLGIAHAIAPEGNSFRRDWGQQMHADTTRLDTDSRLGLQANWSLDCDWELMAQAVVRSRAPEVPVQQAVEWAMASWKPNADWNVRIGRMGIDLFFLTDYGSVGYAYTASRTPIELYGQLALSPMEGVSVTRTWSLPTSTWRARLGVGHALPIHVGQVVADGHTRIDLGTLAQLWVQREAGPWRVRLNIMHADHMRISGPAQDAAYAAVRSVAMRGLPTVSPQARQLASLIGNEPQRLTFVTGGAQYESPDWFGSLEGGRLFGNGRSDGSSVAYLQIGRHVGSWSWFVEGSALYTRSWSVRPDWVGALTPVVGADQAAALQAAALGLDDSLANQPRQTSLGAGVRWDFHPQAALKLQVNRSRVQHGHWGLWTARSHQTPDLRHATLVSALVDFVF